MLGRYEQALQMKRDVYIGYSKLHGEEHEETLRAAYNYAHTLLILQRFEDAKALLRKTILVARRVLGEPNILTLEMRQIYARALCENPAATLDDLREAVTTLGMWNGPRGACLVAIIRHDGDRRPHANGGRRARGEHGDGLG